MPLLVTDIKMPLDTDEAALAGLMASSLSLPKSSVHAVRIVRQSLDARKKNDIHFRISAVVFLEPDAQARALKCGGAHVQPYAPPESYALRTGTQTPKGRIIIAGMGPAGLFAAYYLAEAGYRPLVLERGRGIERRAQDVARFFETGRLDKDSNVVFGEGGAGTFSDGKLTSRSKNPRAEEVLKTFVRHGAPDDIATLAKPHIGTDILQVVVKSMRAHILEKGGEIRFETRLKDITARDGALTHILVEHAGMAERVEAAALVLAAGQAAHDVYEMLSLRGVELCARPFAVGMRIEHPQALINRAQFGALHNHARLGAAEYALTAKSGGRGVYTFCMCPGGQVVAATPDEGGIVVNGMSLRARDGVNANAAILVQAGPEDFGHDPFAGLRFREELERKAFTLGGGEYRAPAQRVEDFFLKRASKAFHEVTPTYMPGVSGRRLDGLFPDNIAACIGEGIRAFARQLKGFDHPDAVLTAVESRPSAPIRILRDERMQAPGIEGLFPVGEGAGYAGGIMSAAIDGLMAAERIAERFAVR